MLENAEAQSEAMKDEDPVNMFLQVLSELLTTSAAELPFIEDYTPGNDRIVGVKGDGFAYLLPISAFNAVQQCLGPGETFPITRPTLWKRMRERGILGPTPNKDPSVSKWIKGKKSRVIPLYAAALQLEPEQIKNAPASRREREGSMD